MKVRQTLTLLAATATAASIQMKDPGHFGCAADYYYDTSLYGC